MASQSSKSCKVLVVGGSPPLLSGTDRILKQLGCTMIGPATSGAEAASLLHEERPNLALLDMTLPGGVTLPLARHLTNAAVPFAAIGPPAAEVAGDPILNGVPHLHSACSTPELRASIVELYRIDLRHKLVRVDRKVMQAWRIIKAQTRLIRLRTTHGHDTRLATELLQAYERTLAVLHAHRTILLRELERQA